MAIDAGDMHVLVQQRSLMGAVRSVSHGKRMTVFGRHHFRQNVGNGRRNIGAAVVANQAGLVVHTTQQ